MTEAGIIVLLALDGQKVDTRLQESISYINDWQDKVGTDLEKVAAYLKKLSGANSEIAKDRDYI